jgi:hypothetical protein
VLDLAALVKVGIEGLPTWRAHVTFAIARHAAVDLTQVLGDPLAGPEDRLPPHELAAVRNELERAGLHLNASSTAQPGTRRSAFLNGEFRGFRRAGSSAAYQR